MFRFCCSGPSGASFFRNIQYGAEEVPARAVPHLHVLHPVQTVQQAVPHAGLQARVRGVQQHVGPPHARVVPPRVQPGQLRERGARLREQARALHPVPGRVLPLARAPRALLALVQGVQGVRVAHVRVRVLALVVRERLVRRGEIWRLEVRGRRVRERRRAGVGSRVRHCTQLGQARAVARDAVMSVLQRRNERKSVTEADRQEGARAQAEDLISLFVEKQSS